MKIGQKAAGWAAVFLLVLGSHGAWGAPKVVEKLIDDFEDGDYTKSPEWWRFDSITASVEKNKPGRPGDIIADEAGAYSLHIVGTAKNWYAGGIGTYLGIDGSKFTGIQLDVKGTGPKSGVAKLELVDDENGNWEVEQDVLKNYALIHDDKFVYELRVDWDGWKRVYIPFTDFTDENPGVGNDKWDPVQTDGSGGLLTLQIICIGPKKTGSLDYTIDNIKLINVSDGSRQSTSEK